MNVGSRRSLGKRSGAFEHPILVIASAIFAAALVMGARWQNPVPLKMLATVAHSTDSVPRYSIFELSLKHNGVYNNNFLDVTLDAVFTSPSGMQHRVKGFFYEGDLWKVRYRPNEVGGWTYTYVLVGKGGFRKEGGADFYSTPSNAEGPVRHHPENPHRWIFTNGKPYFPVGLNDCFYFQDNQLRNIGFDGEERRDNGRRISVEDYFSVYGQAGFNLLRFSQKNCSYVLYDDLDHYRKDESIATDKLLSLARKHGFRVMFGFFGFHGKHRQGNRLQRVLKRIIHKTQRIIHKTLGMGARWFQGVEAIMAPNDHETIAKEKRFINYAVARWGVYVDFWELLNERKASDEWTTQMADYVRSVDPERKPISTSWRKPYLPAIDINSPHWYESESELDSDLRVQRAAAKWKRAGKPVIVGEQGNSGMNWDPRSGLRMRIRTWTTLFQEISFVFWNTSWSKAGVHYGRYSPGRVSNIYLGPEERGYIRTLQNFSSRLDSGVRMTSVEVSSPELVRAYGLVSSSVAAAYLHHFKDHTTAVSDQWITIDLPGVAHSTTKLLGEWIEPSTGNVLARAQLTPGRQKLDVPPFTVDLALLVTPERDRLQLKRAGTDRAPHAPEVEKP